MESIIVLSCFISCNYALLVDVKGKYRNKVCDGRYHRQHLHYKREIFVLAFDINPVSLAEVGVA